MSIPNSRSLCKRHPSHNAIGVCHLCLEKHLHDLIVKRREEEQGGFKNRFRNHEVNNDLRSEVDKHKMRNEAQGEKGVWCEKGKVHWRGEFKEDQCGEKSLEEVQQQHCDYGDSSNNNTSTSTTTTNTTTNTSTSSTTTNFSHSKSRRMNVIIEGVPNLHDSNQSMPACFPSPITMIPFARKCTGNCAPARIHGVYPTTTTYVPSVEEDQESCNQLQICDGRSESGTPEEDVLEAVNWSSSGSYRRLHVDLERMRQIGGGAKEEEGRDMDDLSILDKLTFGEGGYRRIHADIDGYGPSINRRRKMPMPLTLNDLLHQEDLEEDCQHEDHAQDPADDKRPCFVALAPTCHQHIAFHNYYYYHYSRTPPSR